MLRRLPQHSSLSAVPYLQTCIFNKINSVSQTHSPYIRDQPLFYVNPYQSYGVAAFTGSYPVFLRGLSVPYIKLSKNLDIISPSSVSGFRDKSLLLFFRILLRAVIAVVGCCIHLVGNLLEDGSGNNVSVVDTI